MSTVPLGPPDPPTAPGRNRAAYSGLAERTHDALDWIAMHTGLSKGAVIAHILDARLFPAVANAARRTMITRAIAAYHKAHQ